MRISDETLTKLLKKNAIVTDEQLASFRERAERSTQSLQEIILDEKVIQEDALTKLFADYADIPYVVVDPRDITSDALALIPERIARQYNAIVFKIDEETGLIHLAMDDPDDIQATSFIQKEIGENVRIYIAPRSNILECLENYRGDVNKELDKVIDIQREDDGTSQQVSESEIAEDSPIAQTVNLLLEYAI
ncbi:secretion system protein E, partial [Candidatus Saccharibacteria bacterium 32-49-10]